MQQISKNAQLLVERRGAAGLIRLNRPEALNSLTLPMIKGIAKALDGFVEDASVAVIVIAGEGERGFCAGGDIRALRESGLAGDDGAERFLREEFRLNHSISTCPKPFVALMDGLTMGGGVGLSAHGRFRVVTERTRLAMPETAIGYVPDVGGSWLLSRVPGELGTWMGLTGLSISGADAIEAGLADCLVRSAQLGALLGRLADLPRRAAFDDVAACLAGLSEKPERSELRQRFESLAPCFAYDRMEEILEALKQQGSDFARETIDILNSRSPTSLVLTLRLLREGRRSQTLGQCLKRELMVCLSIRSSHDLIEGIRAAVIDKDRQPQWSPSRLPDVDEEMIERCFEREIAPLQL